tara:strand:+ start:27923 stop:28159 length:237 start_codon:yes stop_codon:yes gene_type:complete
MNKSQSVNDNKLHDIKALRLKVKNQLSHIKSLEEKLHRYKGVDTRKNDGCNYSRSNAVSFFSGGVTAILFYILLVVVL